MADGDEKPAEDLTEEMKRKVACAVNKEMSDYETKFVERSVSHMQKIVTLAPEIAKTTKAVYDAFMKAGFDENRSFALAMEMVKGRGVIGY
jgi:hypothetical protein